RVRIRARVRATAMELMRIHSIPWELTYDDGGDGFLALDPQIQLVRYLNVAAAVPDALRLGGESLEVLVAIASPSDQSPLGVTAERAAIEHALAGVARVTVLTATTRARLVEALAARPYDVLHFIGHGAGPSERRTGGIMLEDDTG